MPKVSTSKNQNTAPHFRFETAMAITLIMSVIFLMASMFVLKPSFFLGDVNYRGNDVDGDYLSVAIENRIGTDIYRADTDGDGLSDGAEVNSYGTNPLQSDSDWDGMPDYTEIMWGSNPLSSASRPPDISNEKDRDADGLNDEDESIWNTNPDNIDTDNDGLTDGEEVHTQKTDPHDKDTDRDYLTDGGEVKWGLNPLERDTDGDGKIDYDEAYEFETNPFIADSVRERGSIFKPFELLAFQEILPVGNGVVEVGAEDPDQYEAACNFHAMEYLDSDGDTVPDDMEPFFASNPFDDDSDNDGFKDGDEIRNGYDPMDPQGLAYLFRDITESWQHRAVGEIAYIVAIQGRLDPLLDMEPRLRRNFEPNDYMTRAEFLKLVLSLMEYLCDEQFVASDNIYKDLRNTDWYYDIMLNATALNLIKGYPDYTIRANQYINRAEVAKVLTVAFDLSSYKSIQDYPQFKDIPSNHWAYNFIRLIAEREITQGYNDQSYRPELAITRAEAFSMVGKAFNFVNDELYRRLAD